MVPGIKIAVLGRCQKVSANKPVCASSWNKPQALGCAGLAERLPTRKSAKS
jgi:hypothetical protein